MSAVRLVAPFFRDFALARDPLNERSIRLEWTPTAGSGYADAHSLSDGTLRFMCLATLLLQPDPPSLVLIDEPELGLHPFAIVQLADLIAFLRIRRNVAGQTARRQLGPRLPLHPKESCRSHSDDQSTKSAGARPTLRQRERPARSPADAREGQRARPADV
ncbi:MAG: AAA family ATPase [Egibacteraceae bacterium]